MASVRSAASAALALAATLLLLAGAPAWYAREELVDERAFADRAASSLDDEAVRRVVADRIVDAIVDQASTDVLAVRPLVASAVEAVTATESFRRLFVLAARDAHGVLLEGETSVILELTRAGALLVGALRSISPEVARRVPADVSPQVAQVEPGELETDVARTLADFARHAPLLLALGLACAAGSLALARRRRLALGALGACAAAAGTAVAGAVTLGGALVADQAVASAGPDEADLIRDAVGAAWGALLGDLRAAALVVAGLGAAVAAVAAGGLRPAHAGGLLRAALATARSRRPAVQGLRGAAAAGAGVAAILAPEATLRVAVVVAGALLAFVGVADLARALERRGAARAPRALSPRLVAAGLVLALAAAAAGGLAAVLDRPSPERERAGPAGGCNGSRALCGRRLNEVVFPTTHNSFSAAERPRWLFANQRQPIERQLEDGVRGLFLDVHPGIRDPDTGRVRTDLAAEGVDRNRVARELSPEALRTADRIAGGTGLGGLSGPRGLYLCHTLCELGAEPLAAQLDVLRRFLERHRGEVVFVLLEPYVPPERIEAALRDAGLLRHVARLRRDAPLPTLGELVAADRRLVVLAERDGGARPWYLPAFSFLQDTPLGAEGAGELSCVRNRGDGDSPLLLVNHWIDRFPPPPSANAAIGRRRALRERLLRCARERRLVPNLVAVDFHDLGAVVDVARELNALGPRRVRRGGR